MEKGGEPFGGMGRRSSDRRILNGAGMGEKETQPPLRHLLNRIRLGDHVALEPLMDHYGENLMHYILSIVGNIQEAEDVFQDTWVKVMTRLESFDLSRPFDPWLFRIARNQAYDHLRRRRRVLSLDGAGPGEPGHVPSPVTEPAQIRLEDVDLAGKLLKCLEPRYREVLWLRFFRELSYRQIGAICRLPLGTVKSRLRRALDRAARMVSQWEEGDDHDQW